MTKSLVNIEIHKDQKVVDSYNLYLAAGLNLTNYSRWVRRILDRGGRDIDWFISDNLKYRNLRIKKRYYFTLDFARAICIQYISPKSNKLIVYLKEEQTKHLK